MVASGGRLRGSALLLVLAVGLVACAGPATTATPSLPASATPCPSATPGGSWPVPTALPSSTATAFASPSATPYPSATPCPATPSPTEAPTASPRPTASPTPRPTPTPAASVLVTDGDRASRQVALTFDMGGRVDPALEIMAWLVVHEVPATIFMTGAMAASTATDAGRKVLALIDAHPELFDLGNHSYGHPDFRTLSAAQMRDELLRTEAAITRACQADPRPFFRPPYGGWNQTVLAAVGAAGYSRTILWDIDTIDWRPIADGGPTAAAIVAKVLAQAQGGSIVLMHLGGYETAAALAGIVAGLQAKGLQPVTLGHLLGV